MSFHPSQDPNGGYTVDYTVDYSIPPEEEEEQVNIADDVSIEL